MDDKKLLTLLEDYYYAQRDVVLYLVWAMDDFDKGRDHHSWNNLLAWCEAKDRRNELWGRFKGDYPRALKLKEGYYP